MLRIVSVVTFLHSARSHDAHAFRPQEKEGAGRTRALHKKTAMSLSDRPLQGVQRAPRDEGRRTGVHIVAIWIDLDPDLISGCRMAAKHRHPDFAVVAAGDGHDTRLWMIGSRQRHQRRARDHSHRAVEGRTRHRKVDRGRNGGAKLHFRDREVC